MSGAFERTCETVVDETVPDADPASTVHVEHVEVRRGPPPRRHASDRACAIDLRGRRGGVVMSLEDRGDRGNGEARDAENRGRDGVAAVAGRRAPEPEVYRANPVALGPVRFFRAASRKTPESSGKPKNRPKSREEEVTPLTAITRARFPGSYFTKEDLQKAGRILKRDGEAAVVAYLSEEGRRLDERAPNFQPPAKCPIVAQSRPFAEWPIYRASLEIQRYVYALKVEDAEKGPRSNPKKTNEARARWFLTTGVDDCGLRTPKNACAQGLEKIFDHTYARFFGVIKKVDNKNEELRERRRRAVERIRVAEEEGEEPHWRDLRDASVEEESAVDPDTGGLRRPPGVNHNLYCYNDVSPRPTSDVRGLSVPSEYEGYERDPDETIASGLPDRLSVPRGTPGYVPEWQRPLLRTDSRRQRRWYSTSLRRPRPHAERSLRSGTINRAGYDPATVEAASARDALLAEIRIGEDWLLLDARGLLRSVRRRGLTPEDGVTLRSLLTFFTGDPVIDTRRGVVTFCHKAATIGVRSRKTVKTMDSRTVLEKLAAGGPFGLVSIDLGQTNPVAAKYSRVTLDGDALAAEPRTREFLPEGLLEEIYKLRDRYDAFMDSTRERAVLSLSPEHQEEIRIWRVDAAEASKARVCERFSLDPTVVPWDEMTSTSTYVADAVIGTGGDPASVTFAWTKKNGESGRTKMRDGAVSGLSGVRVKLGDDARKAWNDAKNDLLRGNAAYDRIARQKLELARRCVNHVLRRAAEATGCDRSRVVVAVEDLKVDNKVFSGCGRIDGRGWDSFFVRKKENRWVIQVLHKAFTDLAAHRGAIVVEATPHRTSTTCPRCGLCDRASRSGTSFVCVGCGVCLDADLEIATDNVEQVTLTGACMPKPPVDASDGRKKKKTGARTRKSSRTVRKTTDTTCSTVE